MRYKLLITKFDESIMTSFLNGNLSRDDLQKEFGLVRQTVVQAFCRVRKMINEKLCFPEVKSDLQIFMFLKTYKDILFGARYDSKANTDSDLVLYMEYLPPEIESSCVKFDTKLNKWVVNWKRYLAASGFDSLFGEDVGD